MQHTVELYFIGNKESEAQATAAEHGVTVPCSYLSAVTVFYKLRGMERPVVAHDACYVMSREVKEFLTSRATTVLKLWCKHSRETA